MTKKEIKKYAKENNCSIRDAQRHFGVEVNGKTPIINNLKVLFSDIKTPKKVRLSDIKTPKTVEEFRHNLKTYFAGIGEDALYVKTQNAPADGIPYDSISSLDDIYKLTGTGWCGDGSSPMITPLIDYDSNEVSEYMMKNAKISDSWGFFGDDYQVYVSHPTVLSDIETPNWFRLDNQILREFYVKVLGEFSGYEVLEQEVA